MNYRDQAEALLRALEASAASSQEHEADIVSGLVAVGYAILADKPVGSEVDKPPAVELGSAIHRANREGFVNELMSIFADTIRGHVSGEVRSELTVRFGEIIRERLAW